MAASLLTPAGPRTTVAFSSPRLDLQKTRVRNLEHRGFRTSPVPDLISACDHEHLSWPQRAARLLVRMCEAEKPVIFPDERIVFTRTVPSVPPVYTSEDWARITGGRTLHEPGPISNICADWGSVLHDGLLRRRAMAAATRERLVSGPDSASSSAAAGIEFLDGAIACIDAVLDLTARYADEARIEGRAELAGILDRVPAHPPRSFHEAVTDTEENLSAIAATVQGLPGLVRVDLLAYNRAAGGKYKGLGRSFRPPYDESVAVQPRVSLFERAAIRVHVSGAIAGPPVAPAAVAHA